VHMALKQREQLLFRAYFGRRKSLTYYPLMRAPALEICPLSVPASPHLARPVPLLGMSRP
jgi:hypothetical protein